MVRKFLLILVCAQANDYATENALDDFPAWPGWVHATGNAFVCKAAFVVFVVAEEAFSGYGFVEGDFKIRFHRLPDFAEINWSLVQSSFHFAGQALIISGFVL